MPPRRKAATHASNAAQSTLSFGGPRSRVTKPSTAQPTGKKTKADPDAVVTDVILKEVETPEPETNEPTTSEIAIREQVKQEVETPRTEVEVRALGISEAQLRKYWKAREAERKAPRVHQGDLSMNEKILRHFDLSSQYGPCIGIARLKRWKRAHEFGLNPPIEVLTILLTEEEKENGKGQRAYVDELMSGRDH